ncbi:MAG: AAA family ATPase [Planctomycetaceae bacterium]
MTLRLTRLKVTGPGKPAAEINFSSPLTVISGASGTGKSHVYQCLVFMLGGSNPPESIPEANGYDCVRLEILGDNSMPFALERGSSGGNFRKYDLQSRDSAEAAKSVVVLKSTHKAGKSDTVSHFLLSNCNLTDRQIRVDQYGTKGSLSFTDVRNFIMVDEERIITRGSPVVGVQYTTSTREKSVFGLLLNGVDDSAIEPVEKDDTRKARLSVEARLLEEITAETPDALTSQLLDTSEIDNRLDKLTRSIEEATQSISAAQSEISELETRRREAWESLQPVRSRQMFVASQLDRFSLLQSYYDSDHDRLQAMVEAEDEFSGLNETDCPLCGRTPQELPDLPPLKATLVAFAEACEQEVVKIRSLKQDLDSTMRTLQEEQSELNNREKELRAGLDRLDAEIKRTLEVRLTPTRDELQLLISQRDQIVQAKATMSGLA